MRRGRKREKVENVCIYYVYAEREGGRKESTPLPYPNFARFPGGSKPTLYLYFALYLFL